MQALNRFLEHSVDKLLDAHALLLGNARLPIDVREVARASGFLTIEEREMIPEAVIRPEGTSFTIFLQNNFSGDPGLRLRQRFSLAHEIAHTFFFELRDGSMKSRRDAPTGEKLEAACHRGAGLILIPNRFLRDSLRQYRHSISAQDIIQLSRTFDASLEVVLRRLIQEAVFESSKRAPILVHRNQNLAGDIEIAAYPTWLKAVLPTPRRGMDFAVWFRSSGGARDIQQPIVQDSVTLGEDGSMARVTALGVLSACPVNFGRSQRLYELSMEP